MPSMVGKSKKTTFSYLRDCVWKKRSALYVDQLVKLSNTLFYVIGQGLLVGADLLSDRKRKTNPT